MSEYDVNVTPPWDEIKETSVVVPAGQYVLQVEDLTVETSGSGKLMLNARFRVLEPNEFGGLPLFERFVVGMDGDVLAKDPETWRHPRNVGARRFKSLVAKAGIRMGTLAETAEASRGQVVGADVRKTIEPNVTKSGEANPYAGQERNTIARFQSVVEMTGRVASAPSVPRPPAGPTNTSPSPPAAVGRLITCGSCGERVPSGGYAAHVLAHQE